MYEIIFYEDKNGNSELIEDNTFILLHHFIKKTRKTPRREIIKAKNNLNDFLERNT